MLLLLTAVPLSFPPAQPTPPSAFTPPSALTIPSEPVALSTFFGLAPQEPKKANFSYSYIELGYNSLELDAIDDEADSIYGRASLGLFEVMHIFFDYSNQSTDFEDTSSDLFGLGIGIHMSIAPKLDLVGEAEWLYNDLSSDLEDLDDTTNGWSGMVGGRWMPMPWEGGGLEFNGGFRWIDLDGLLSDDSVGAWEVGTRVHFLNLLSVGAKYQFLEDDEQWGVDARVSF